MKQQSKIIISLIIGAIVIIVGEEILKDYTKYSIPIAIIKGIVAGSITFNLIE